MNRRNFLKTGVLGALFAASPVSISAIESATRPSTMPGRMTLSFAPYELRLRHAFNLARSQRTTTPGVQVQITCDGITGYGEASMPPYLGENVESVTSFLSKLDLSQFKDPFRIEDIHDYMESVAPDNRAAKASVDIALHDLTGKIMGQPWYKIWGLNPDKTPNTSFTISYDADPEEMRRKIEETAPFKVVKVKMGLDHDKEIVEALRRQTDVPICVDANQAGTIRRRPSRCATGSPSATACSWSSLWTSSPSTTPPGCASVRPCPSSPTSSCSACPTSSAPPVPTTASTSSS